MSNTQHIRYPTWQNAWGTQERHADHRYRVREQNPIHRNNVMGNNFGTIEMIKDENQQSSSRYNKSSTHTKAEVSKYDTY